MTPRGWFERLRAPGVGARAGAALIGALLAGAGPAAASEWTSQLALEMRNFPMRPLFPEQHRSDLSFAWQPEARLTWDENRQSLTVVAFVRVDRNDPERTHADVRELIWRRSSPAWQLKAGLGKVFWGVTESRHLVDVINQTDRVENPDGEDKLGQPMVNLTLIGGWGNLDLFMLPGFRAATFPGREGRLRSPYPVAADREVYASRAGSGRVDWAMRWSRSVGPFDIGLAHFSGTNRNPRFLPGTDGAGRIVLVPHYDLFDQTSLDLQATLGNWLWKVEAASRDALGSRSTAMVGGFEYTFWGLGGTAADLGVLAEYLYDDQAAGTTTPFEDDLFFGARLAMNDASDTDLLAGMIVDREGGGSALSIEAGRRLSEGWKLEIEARAALGTSANDPLNALRRDHYVQTTITRYF